MLFPSGNSSNMVEVHPMKKNYVKNRKQGCYGLIVHRLSILQSKDVFRSLEKLGTIWVPGDKVKMKNLRGFGRNAGFQAKLHKLLISCVLLLYNGPLTSYLSLFIHLWSISILLLLVVVSVFVLF